jgi:hypothetical protein
MKVRYLCWLLLLLPFCAQAQSQRLDWGIQVGTEWMQLRGLAAFPPGRTGQLKDFRSASHLLPSVGLHTRFSLHDRFALRAGLRFLPQDYAMYFTWFDQLPHREDIRGWELGIPLLLEVHNPAMPASPYAFLGPVFSLHHRQPPSSVHQLAFKSQEVGINFGVGLILGKKGPIFRPEFNFHLGLTNILRGARDARYLEEVGRRLRRDYVALRLLIEP